MPTHKENILSYCTLHCYTMRCASARVLSNLFLQIKHSSPVRSDQLLAMSSTGQHLAGYQTPQHHPWALPFPACLTMMSCPEPDNKTGCMNIIIIIVLHVMSAAMIDLLHQYVACLSYIELAEMNSNMHTRTHTHPHPPQGMWVRAKHANHHDNNAQHVQ